jgi:hypothetical protein
MTPGDSEVDGATGSSSKVHRCGILHKTVDAIEVPSDGSDTVDIDCLSAALEMQALQV